MQYLYGDETVWGVPGGGVNEGESLIDALKRELKEELGVSIEVGDLLCLIETPSTERVEHTLHCVFAGKITDGKPSVNPGHTSASSVRWLGIHEIADSVLYPPANDIIGQALLGNIKAEYLGLRRRQWF